MVSPAFPSSESFVRFRCHVRKKGPYRRDPRGPGDDAASEVSSGNLSAKRVSCRRSYCGAGDPALHADWRWKIRMTPTPAEKVGELRNRLPAPTDLYGDGRG